MSKLCTALLFGGSAFLAAGAASAAPVYLNIDNISVAIGSGTSAGTFNNTFDDGSTINKAIDAPTANAAEFHEQDTHIWFTADVIGGGLELLFDFGKAYDISTLHFWNYNGEAYDVDEIVFSFFDVANTFISDLTINPALGSSPAIYAQDIALPAPLNVRYVSAFLSGTNRQVDFQNIGFTAEVSAPPVEPVPLPAGGLLAISALGGLAAVVRRRR